MQDSFQFLFCFDFLFVCLFFNQHVLKVCSMLGTVPIPQKGRSENDQRPHILSLWENQEIEGKEKQAIRDSGAAILARSNSAFSTVACMYMLVCMHTVYVHAHVRVWATCALFFDMVLPPQLELSGCLDYQPANPRLCLSLLPHHWSYRYPPLTWVAGDQTQFLKLIQQTLCPLRHRPKVLAIDFADEL